MEFAMLVTEPETSHKIYHLSVDDVTVLCGRNTKRMVCVGVTNENDVGVCPYGAGSYVDIRRICRACYKALLVMLQRED